MAWGRTSTRRVARSWLVHGSRAWLATAPSRTSTAAYTRVRLQAMPPQLATTLVNSFRQREQCPARPLAREREACRPCSGTGTVACDSWVCSVLKRPHTTPTRLHFSKLHDILET